MKYLNISSKRGLFALLTILNFSCYYSVNYSVAKAELIDKVIASIDDQPITLSDLNSYTNNKYNFKSLSKDTYESDPSYKKAVEQLIHFKLLDIEARDKNVKVTEKEIESYIKNLASQNSLSIDDFSKALSDEGKSLFALKQQIKYQTLQNKLLRLNLKGKVEPSKEDIDEAIKKRFSETEGTFVEIRKVTINTKDLPEKVLIERIDKIKRAINSDTPFSDIVNAYSDNADDSSILTKLDDFHPDLKQALSSIPEGGLAEPVTINNIVTLAQVVRKIEGNLLEERSIREQIRVELREFKLQKNIEKFVSEDLPNKHIVNRMFSD